MDGIYIASSCVVDHLKVLYSTCHINPFTHAFIQRCNLHFFFCRVHTLPEEPSEVKCLTKGHFSIQTGGSGDQITGLLVSGLPPEPQTPVMSIFPRRVYIFVRPLLKVRASWPCAHLLKRALEGLRLGLC